MDSENYLMDTLSWFCVPSCDCDSSCTHWIDQDWDGSVDRLFPGLLDNVCYESCSPYCVQEGEKKSKLGTNRCPNIYTYSTLLVPSLTSVS